MKDDTISRKAAIKAADSIIERDTSGNNDVVKAMTAWKEYIKALPPAQRWIPCSTALPDDDTEVIVSCTDDSGDYEYSYVTTGWHYKGLWVVNNDRCYFVRAWQPLPAKPWEGDTNDT